MKRMVESYVSVFMLLSFFLLFGCSSKKEVPLALVSATDPAAIGSEESLTTSPIGIMEGRTSGPMLPVYFEFDSYIIKGNQKPRLMINKDYLLDSMDKMIRIEGNCDPRGTREYNLALGEKRALSAKKYLINLGVASDRIKTVSLGEEKILLHGHDEMAWSQNRRDDFVIE